MICSFGAILAWKSDAAAAAADYDDDYKSDPYMSPSYAGDTKMAHWFATLRHLGPQNYTAPLTMYLHVGANFQPGISPDTARKRKAPMGVNIYV